MRLKGQAISQKGGMAKQVASSVKRSAAWFEDRLYGFFISHYAGAKDAEFLVSPRDNQYIFDLPDLKKRVILTCNPDASIDATELYYRTHTELERTAAEQKLQEDNRSKAESKKFKLTAQKSTIEGNISIFERTLENLDKPVCPISSKLVCTTDKTGIKAELEKSITDNKKLIDDIDKQMKSCNETLSAYKIWKKAFDEDMEHYRQKLKVIERYRTLKDHPVLVPVKPVAADASTVASKKSELVAEKVNCENYARMCDLEKYLADEQEEISVLDYLISAFKDKGEVKEAIIRGYLSLFEDTMNKRANEFCPGYAVALSVSGGLKVALKTPYNKQAYDLSVLSGGEKLITRFLMLDMLSQLTGTNLMFIDNIESLDKDALERLADILNGEAFTSLYDHVFVAGVDHPDVMEKFS